MRRISEIVEIRDRLLTEATIAPTADVLDLGCGTGMLTYPAAEESGRAFGFDLDPAAVAAAAGVPGINAIFACADAARLPLPNNSFDVVLWRGLLAYAPEPARILAEALRVLRPEGRLCFAESLSGEMEVPPGGDQDMVRLWDALREIGGAALGRRAPSRDDVKALVDDAGFADTRVQVERRRTTLEDARAVTEVFDATIPGGRPLASVWREAGVPEQLVDAFLSSLTARTPMQLITPEGYATATKPR